MKFKTFAITALAFAIPFSVSSTAMAANIEYDYATVLDVEPIIKTVRVMTPRQECWQEEVVYDTRYDDHRYDNYRGGATSTIVGGVIGGAIGNALGHHKKNKQVGAVIGALLGATIGNAVAAEKRRKSQQEDIYSAYNQPVSYGYEERCEIIQETHIEEEIVGYKVRYRYSNATYSTRMKVDPGDTIKVRLTITPVT